MNRFNRNATIEGIGKLMGHLFYALYSKKWFKWFIRIFFGLIILGIIKNVALNLINN